MAERTAPKKWTEGEKIDFLAQAVQKMKDGGAKIPWSTIQVGTPRRTAKAMMGLWEKLDKQYGPATSATNAGADAGADDDTDADAGTDAGAGDAAAPASVPTTPGSKKRASKSTTTTPGSRKRTAAAATLGDGGDGIDTTPTKRRKPKPKPKSAPVVDDDDDDEVKDEVKLKFGED
ncbi:hypothetical protein GGR51DRAFT_555063 [Nemania sp. FL0031]|nr:hypothetical protein GGR51DRAFT_555063 [Nemania sp. FL0031]